MEIQWVKFLKWTIPRSLHLPIPVTGSGVAVLNQNEGLEPTGRPINASDTKGPFTLVPPGVQSEGLNFLSAGFYKIQWPSLPTVDMNLTVIHTQQSHIFKNK